MAAAERAAALIQRLLAFARRQPLRPQVIDLNRLVADTEHLLRRTLDETITIETVLGGGLWPCETDPAQLESVVLNLAINARDAMPRGGQLTIETGNARLDRHYAEEHEDVNPGQYVMLAVSDNGSGMEPGVLRQVFEPFFTTKPTGEGSGLGLSMVYGFVKQSGGHVKIYSELGHGTTAKMYLPRCDGATMLRTLRRDPSYNDLKVFAISGYPPEQLGIDARKAGIDRWFQKPINAEALLGELREQLKPGKTPAH